jgi:mono/diheme cytochrome c family protein
VLWTENCQPCHGPTGKGDGPAAQNIPDPLPDFSNPETARSYVPAETFQVIKEGRIEKLMPPWGNRLSDTQIWDLTAFVWSLSTTPEEISAGEALYAKECAACHGNSGVGDGPKVSASAKMVSFTDLSTAVQRSQANLMSNFQSSDQHAALSYLSEAELYPVLDYIRSFSFKLPQRNGVLRGQVINATTNKPQGNIEVTLRVFEGNSEVETKTGWADSAGNYTFEQLSTDHSTLYAVEGRYKDVTYLSNQPGIFTPDSSETTLNLNVYEATTSAEAIGITQFHYLISFAPDMLNVVQIFVLGNRGNQAYIGQNGQTFSFSLPQNARSVTFQNDENGTRFVQTAQGYADTAPITPGEESQSIIVMYGVPYEDNLTLKIPLPADVASANVLMQDQGAELNSDQLQFVETREFQGDPFSIFSGANLKKGEELILQLTKLDNLQFASEFTAPGEMIATHGIDQNLLRWVVLGLGGLVIVLVAVGYPRLRPQLTHEVNSHSEDPNLRRQKLLVMLARLDELFESGELDKQIYHRARAKYKAELVELMER